MGILAERLEDDGSVSFDIECPPDYTEGSNLAHATWTAGMMSEMCGHTPLWLGVVAFTGTVATRYQAAVPVGEKLVGRATLEGRERRKLFVNTTLASSATGVELAKGSGIMIAAELQDLESRGLI